MSPGETDESEIGFPKIRGPAKAGPLFSSGDDLRMMRRIVRFRATPKHPVTGHFRQHERFERGCKQGDARPS
jgi:hypothetical protein